MWWRRGCSPLSANALHANWPQWGQWMEVLPSKWQQMSAVTVDNKEPCAAKVYDVPTIATTYIYLFLADDTTNISSNQNRGAVSWTALHLWYLGCKPFRAAIASHCEHFHSFGWKESCSYHGHLPNLHWCWAVWRQCILLRTQLHKQQGSLDLPRSLGL